MAIESFHPGMEDEEKKKENVEVGAPAPTIGGGGGAPGGGGQAVGAPAQAGKGPSQSGSFTDMGKYIKANQPRIGKFAGQVTSGVEQKLNEAGQAVQSEAAKHQEAIAKGKTSADVFQGKNVADIDVNQGRNVLSGVYSGPSAEKVALESIANIDAAKRTADLAQSYSGKQALLGEALGGKIGDYSRGERNLDAAFLSRDAAAKEKFAGLQGQAKDISAQAATQQEALSQQVADTIAANKANSAEFLKKLQSEEAALAGGLRKDEEARRLMLYGDVDPIMSKLRDYLKGEAYRKAGATNLDKLQEERRLALSKLMGRDVTGVSNTAGLEYRQSGPITASKVNEMISEEDMFNTGVTGANFGGLSQEQQARADALRALAGDTHGLGTQFSGRGSYDAEANKRLLIENLFRQYLT